MKTSKQSNKLSLLQKVVTAFLFMPEFTKKEISTLQNRFLSSGSEDQFWMEK